MSHDISAFGIGAYLIADQSLPLGYYINAFADDSDAITFEALTVNNVEIDLNGKLFSAFEAHPVVVTISVIPQSIDDQTMRMLLNANHVSRYQNAVGDTLTLTVKYPDFSVLTLRDGRMIGGPSGLGAKAEGRYITNTYTLHFADVSVLNAATIGREAVSRATQIFDQRFPNFPNLLT